MRIGVLTGGVDVPGLNSCIKAIVNRAENKWFEVYGFRRGWAGPLNIDPDNEDDRDQWVEQLNRQSVRTIDRSGGTVLHTSRTNPKRVARDNLPGFLADRHARTDIGTVDCTDHILSVMEHLGIDALILIGGDDTLSYAAALSGAGFPVVAAPKTMDNDVNGTDYCIGFSTAVSRSIEFIHVLRTTTGSHERIAVVELFGRNSGMTALISGYLADADRVLIAEAPFDIGRLAELVAEDYRQNPSHYAMVVISEGAQMVGRELIESGKPDDYGHRRLGGIGQMTAEFLETATGIEAISQRLAYLMRAGVPDSLDRMGVASFGHLAVEQLAYSKNGVMMALADGKYTTVPIDTCIKAKKRVEVDAFYDVENYRPRITLGLDRPMFA